MANARAVFTKVAAPRKLADEGQLAKLFPYLTVVMILFTLVALFHVWSRAKVVDLSLQISDFTREIKEAEQEAKRLRVEVASLKTPKQIEALAKGELGMVMPTNQQVIVVK